MAGWDDLSFWQTPIALGDPSRAQVAGYDELGRPTLRGFDGRVYSLPLPETQTYPDWLNDATASMDPMGRGINEDRPSRGENALAGLSALTRNPLAAVPNPMGPNTYGDAWNTALGMMAGGAAATAPSGAVRAGLSRGGFEDLLAAAKGRIADRTATAERLAADASPVRMQSQAGLRALVSPSSDRPGQWRITTFGQDGQPSGHIDATDKRAAVMRALEDGFAVAGGR